MLCIEPGSQCFLSYLIFPYFYQYLKKAKKKTPINNLLQSGQLCTSSCVPLTITLGWPVLLLQTFRSVTNGKSDIMAVQVFFIQGGSVASSLQMNFFMSTEHWRYITKSKLHSESGATAFNCAERWWQLQNIQSICIWLRKNAKWSVQAEQIWKPCELIYNTPLPYMQ